MGIDYRDYDPRERMELEPLEEEEEVSRNQLYLELKEIWRYSQEFENTYLTNKLKKLMDKF
jgi:hypothetical protein